MTPMPTTVVSASDARHREECASVRVRTTRADDLPHTRTSRLGVLAGEVIDAVAGNARAGAIDIGIHEGHLSRLKVTGQLRLEQLERLGPAFVAKFGARLVEEYGPLSDPKDQARKTIAVIERACVELKQFIEIA